MPMIASLLRPERGASQGPSGKTNPSLPQGGRPAFVLVLCFLTWCLAVPCVLAAGYSEELTKEQREELERRADELSNQAIQLYQKAQPAAATKLMEQALQIVEALYPDEEDPQGHIGRINCLGNLGIFLWAQGKSAQALPYLERALRMCERLYPQDKFPQGHPELAKSLKNLGMLLQSQGQYDRAVSYGERGLKMTERLYPKDRYPLGHPELAHSLNNLAAMYQSQGNYLRALPYYHQTLEMKERLYPKDKFPEGHPDLAVSLSNLGLLLDAQGEYARALGYLEEAVKMNERLYPAKDYPRRHPDLATSLGNLSALFYSRGELSRALPYRQQALDMYERLYPTDEYPDGHSHVERGLNNVGFLLMAQGEYARALPYYQRALAMAERLYPTDKYPQGHAVLAVQLNNFGSLLQAQGESTRALPYHQRALAMIERLYPTDKYPQGHPNLNNMLHNLGALFQTRGEYASALDYFHQALVAVERLYPQAQYPQGHPHRVRVLISLGGLHQARWQYAHALAYYEQAMAMSQDLLDVFVDAASEAEALNFAAQLPLVRDSLLSVSRHLPGTDDLCYGHIWRGKAAVTRMLERRHRAFLQGRDLAGRDDDVKQQQIRQVGQDLLATRRRLSQLLLSPGGSDPIRRGRLQELSSAKEKLERQLAELLPAFARRRDVERLGHGGLVEKLPVRTAFCDLLKYVRFEQDPKVPGKAGEKRTPCYVGFVLRKGQPVRRLELGPAAPIENALAGWRQDLADRKASPAADALRRLVWQPLAEHLPADTDTALLAPGGALTRLPWAALPGNKPGTVLLEDYAVAFVPHGPFVLDRLTADPPKDKEPGLLLAVGGVSYDKQPKPVGLGAEDLFLARLAERGGKALAWDYLPGSLKETDQVIALADKRPVRGRRGTEATTAQLLLDLPQARWVHLATHGFFADRSVRSVLQLDEKLFDEPGRTERAAPGARNPLVLSGLVLAGANLPPPTDLHELMGSDGGILTAEAIAGLPLGGLELAVLSACETGLGEVAGGEGVFGLQRAFHLAGARTVVASLWKVDDSATQALMAEFYRNLWEKKQGKLQALRRAQLTMLRQYDPQQGGLRGPVIAKTDNPLDTRKAQARKVLPPFYWAAFVLSGEWR